MASLCPAFMTILPLDLYMVFSNKYLSMKNGISITIHHKYKYYYSENQFIELDGYGDNYAVEVYLANDLKGSKY